MMLDVISRGMYNEGEKGLGYEYLIINLASILRC